MARYDESSARTDGSAPGTTGAQAFYGRWATVYDLIASYTPGVSALRRRVASACGLKRGDTVVELGCGTGANLPYLREAVGSSGTVVGVDVTGPVLRRARRYAAEHDNVHLVRADATRPPLAGFDGVVDGGSAGGGEGPSSRGGDERGPRRGEDPSPASDEGPSPSDSGVDAVVATFLVGMLADPAAAVDDWCDLVGPGGRVVLANATRSDRWYAPAVNAIFRAIVLGSTPPTAKLRYDADLTARLDAKVAAAHDRLRERSEAAVEARHLFGVVRFTGGIVGSTVDDGSERPSPDAGGS